MTTIVTRLVKFRCNMLPMVICTSIDIFQDEANKILGDNQGVKKYIYYILFLSKDNTPELILHIRVIFDKIIQAGLNYMYGRGSIW